MLSTGAGTRRYSTSDEHHNNGRPPGTSRSRTWKGILGRHSATTRVHYNYNPSSQQQFMWFANRFFWGHSTDIHAPNFSTLTPTCQRCHHRCRESRDVSLCTLRPGDGFHAPLYRDSTSQCIMGLLCCHERDESYVKIQNKQKHTVTLASQNFVAAC